MSDYPKNEAALTISTGRIYRRLRVIKSVSTKLAFKDIIGGLKVRFGIMRSNYKVSPGLYKVGNPDKFSVVLVSANYKLTFDCLKKELDGLDCFLLILNTKGINVWCAAGKGTFGTSELVHRIQKVRLSEVISHKELILPQLGAAGISAHEVYRLSGYTVKYGPVRSCDIKEYLKGDCYATEAMRMVRFNFSDRLILVPMELIPAIKQSFAIFGVLFILNLFVKRPFGVRDFSMYMSAIASGSVLTPLFLPLLPGRIFSFKGWFVGLLSTLAFLFHYDWFNSWMLSIAYLLVLPSVSAYLAMNFTGSSTYTSFSGVTKEMKTALIFIVLSVAIGAVLLLLNCFIG